MKKLLEPCVICKKKLKSVAYRQVEIMGQVATSQKKFCNKCARDLDQFMKNNVGAK